MQIVRTLATLQPGRAYWVPAVESPQWDWPAVPGCRRGARFLIGAESLAPAHAGFPAFDSRAECLRWIMQNRADIATRAPGATAHAARLDAWMLGMDAV
jgi:hypothetical protein